MNSKSKFFEKLRMVFGIASAIMLLGIVFIFTYCPIIVSVVYTAIVVALFLLCLLFKKLQENEQEKLVLHGDFITGKIKQEDNENI